MVVAVVLGLPTRCGDPRGPSSGRPCASDLVMIPVGLLVVVLVVVVVLFLFLMVRVVSVVSVVVVTSSRDHPGIFGVQVLHNISFILWESTLAHFVLGGFSPLNYINVFPELDRLC